MQKWSLSVGPGALRGEGQPRSTLGRALSRLPSGHVWCLEMPLSSLDWAQSSLGCSRVRRATATRALP